MDFTKISNDDLRKIKVTLGFKVLARERVTRRMRASLDEIQVEIVRRGLSDIPKSVDHKPVDYKAKYEKCIAAIKKFDPGIIGMYDL
jgi:hypothetical protein